MLMDTNDEQTDEQTDEEIIMDQVKAEEGRSWKKFGMYTLKYAGVVTGTILGVLLIQSLTGVGGSASDVIEVSGPEI